MKLIDCYIENFGKLTDYTYRFTDGINCIKEDNGYGKTTLSVFIKAMLFGLDDTKRTKLESNDRKHYLPWNGQSCRGSLTFSANGKTYRIERTFMPKAQDDSFKLYDCESGKESHDYSERVGEELFSIDADGFERTVFLSEANLCGKNENKTVSAKLSDLVGYDGDVGAMDEAIELLEKQRKTYHRRGGAGEIGEIRKKISEITNEINDLTRLKEAYAAEEERLGNIIGELDSLYKERARLEVQARHAEAERIKRGYDREYRRMEATVADELLKQEALDKFFACGIPTSDEIEGAKEMLLEAKRLESGDTASEDTRFQELETVFENKGAELFLKIKTTADGINELHKEKELVERELDVAKNAENFSHAPDLATLNELIVALTAAGKKKKPSPIFWIFGLVTVAASIALGIALNPLCYLISVVGVLLFIPAIVSVFASDSSAILEDERVRARIIIKKHGLKIPTTDTEILNSLLLLKGLAEGEIGAKQRCESLIERKNEISEKILYAEREACEIIALFPAMSAKNIKDALYEILRKKELYEVLKEREGYSKDAKERKLIEAKKLRGHVDTFLSRFPTETASPFEEISRKLIEYSTLSNTIKRMNADLLEFKKRHGISDTPIVEEALAESIDPSALSEKILELEQKKAVSERECRLMSDDIDRIDELYSQKEELNALEVEYRKKLNVILKTQEFLNEAKDSITTKYLSKTKAAFEKYLGIILREGAPDFSMDTSFTVMKNERGTLRPIEAYSRGTRDLYALATRLALIDSLYENESPFIIFDDPFAHFDDDKTAAAIEALVKIAKFRQIIYFTCADSRKIPTKKRA